MDTLHLYFPLIIFVTLGVCVLLWYELWARPHMRRLKEEEEEEEARRATAAPESHSKPSE